jgi:hypothetical protein
MRCDYCDNETELVNEWQEVTCESCQFQHEVAMHTIDAMPANDGTASHVFITLNPSHETQRFMSQLTLDEAKAFATNLEVAIRIAEEMDNRNAK